MIQFIQFKSARVYGCLLLMGMALAGNSSAHAWDLVETFSGTGSYSATGGPTGFENPGWNIAGTPGSFGSNGFGEDVFQVATTPPSVQDGLFRVVGSDAFSAIAEFSNPLLSSNSLTGGGLTVVDSPDSVGLFVLRNSSGNFSASFAGSVGGSFAGGGSLSLGSNVDRFTLLLEFEPDAANGGGLFNGYVDVNESGSYSLIGTIDGTQYTTDATTNRVFFLGTTGFENSASVELDQVTISSSAVPEPTACSILVCGLLFAMCRRRNRRRTVR